MGVCGINSGILNGEKDTVHQRIKNIPSNIPAYLKIKIVTGFIIN